QRARPGREYVGLTVGCHDCCRIQGVCLYNRRLVFTVMAAAGLTLIAAMTRPAAKVPFPTVLRLALLPGGMIEFNVIGPPYGAIRVGHGLLASVGQVNNRQS